MDSSIKHRNLLSKLVILHLVQVCAKIRPINFKIRGLWWENVNLLFTICLCLVFWQLLLQLTGQLTVVRGRSVFTESRVRQPTDSSRPSMSRHLPLAPSQGTQRLLSKHRLSPMRYIHPQVWWVTAQERTPVTCSGAHSATEWVTAWVQSEKYRWCLSRGGRLFIKVPSEWCRQGGIHALLCEDCSQDLN